jgi:hypothetical protein
MSLQDHVASLELCKKWKEIGGRQDTIFAWRSIENGKWFIDYLSFYTHPGIQQFSAPLASELMEWNRNRIGCLWPINWEENKTKWTVELFGDEEPLVDKLLDVLMQMAIEIELEKK